MTVIASKDKPRSQWWFQWDNSRIRIDQIAQVTTTTMNGRPFLILRLLDGREIRGYFDYKDFDALNKALVGDV